jgi:hypothetical protein
MLTLVHRPLLLMLLLGCAVSLGASGRLTVRLIADGAFSFAFIPLSELAGFAIVYRLRPPPLPFAEAVDRFFAGNTPWLWWWLAFMIAVSVIPVLRHGEIMAPLLITSLIPIVSSVFIDTRFFRSVMSRRPGRARLDVALLRIVSWSAGIAYFIGYASSSRDFFYLFVEIGDEVAAWVMKWT